MLAPLYGILIADYYLIHRQKLDEDALFSTDPNAAYHYQDGWNRKAIVAFGVAAIFSIATVWVPALASLSGFGWIIGAVLGGGFHVMLMRQTSSGQRQA